MVFQAGLAAAGAEPELLEPERAFQLSAVYKDSKTVELRYKIADGYYMYRGRFKFDLGSVSAARLGKAMFPKGNMKQDPSFGRVETLERENADLRRRLSAATVRTREVLDQVRFIRQQTVDEVER